MKLQKLDYGINCETMKTTKSRLLTYKSVAFLEYDFVCGESPYCTYAAKTVINYVMSSIYVYIIIVYCSILYLHTTFQ